jgi:uncharacterized repeat protein (TIGR01451 family)
MTTRTFAISSRSLWMSSLGLACCFGTAAAPRASAATTGASSAYGEALHLTLAPLVGGGLPIDSGPLPEASGNAPPPYSQAMTQADVTVQGSMGLGKILSTGILSVEADSNVPRSNQAHARAEVDNTSLLVTSLLNLSANVIVSEASIGGTCGSSLTPVGTSTFVSASLGGIVGTGLTVPPNPAPNTELLNQLGIRVVLNEQLLAGDGTTRETLSVNALHVYLSNVSLGTIGALNGDIVVSHSQAALDCNGLPDSADLSISKSASPNPATQGQSLTYTITVANAGPSAASDVVVTDPLPAGVSFVSVTPSQGSCSGMATAACGGGTTLSCGLGTLGSGGSALLTIAVVPTQAGTVVNHASVSSSTRDPNPDNNSVATSTTINSRFSGGCVPSATVLCVDDQPGDQRFEITSEFSTVEGGGRSGPARALPLSSLGVTHGGLLWFFSPDNPEMLIKVLNACALDQKFWVFYAAGTNVGFTVTVHDTKTGNKVVYANRDLTVASPMQDTRALPCN